MSPRGKPEDRDFLTTDMSRELRYTAYSYIRSYARGQRLTAARSGWDLWGRPSGRWLVRDAAGQLLVSGLTAAEVAAWLQIRAAETSGAVQPMSDRAAGRWDL